MSGTIIPNLSLVKVVDGDTVKVDINGKTESLRLTCLDTEESLHGSSKPVTNAGKLASAWAKQFFGVNDEGLPAGTVHLDIEFDTDDPADQCLIRHRGNYGRLLCYVHREGENYNLEAVKNGWSPYFVKYGRSRLYHEQFIHAEIEAQSSGTGIWDPGINSGGSTRNYTELIPWWHYRDAAVQAFRMTGPGGNAKSVRLDYAEIIKAAKNKSQITVFADLQNGIDKWCGGGALIYAGSPEHKFNLWIPDCESPVSQKVLRLIQTRYAGNGRGYVYITGTALMYPENEEYGKPEIIITDMDQISDSAAGG